MLKQIFLGLGFCLYLTGVRAEFLVEGKLMIDSSWAPVIYLSAIPSLENMYTVSDDMIILRAPLDTGGYFRLIGDFLPGEDRLYRLHLSKKGDPPSTIIIGGKDENHMFLILNHQTQCSLVDTSANTLWEGVWVEKCPLNNRLREIDQIFEQFETQASRDFFIGREFMNIALHEKLRHYADTCSHYLLALYALQQTNIETHSAENPGYYISFLEKWKAEKGSYLEDLRRRIAVPESNSPSFILPFVIGIFGLLIGLSIRPVMNKLKKTGQQVHGGLFKQLSIQERKIFSLIKDGKSNKEIAALLHIELATVKSHIRNIYAKLEIKTRREVLDFPHAEESS